MRMPKAVTFLSLILVMALVGGYVWQGAEGFSNNFTLTATGLKPTVSGELDSPTLSRLVADTYPATNNPRGLLSSNGAANVWWHYPTFKLGSYKQITNNIRYPNNPDVGDCMPASMCGTLYKEKHLGNNEVTPLPPLNPGCPGTRVGYFQTDVNLLPFKTNMQNILF